MNKTPRPLARRLLAVVVALAVVTAVAVFVPSEKPVSESVDSKDGLDQCVATMLSSAKDGKVSRYMSCFGGGLRDKLKNRLAKSPPDRAAAELSSGEADLKSYVTTEWKYINGDEATLVLERIYTQFNKRHLVRLRRINGAWKIVELTPLESFAPEIPYGTPVFELPPAGTQQTDEENSDRSRKYTAPGQE